MKRTTSFLIGAALLAGAGLVSAPALANGGDFFNELSQSWDAHNDSGTPYFGFIRDANGRGVPRAMVTATVQDGPDGSSLTILADNLGHYRIPGMGKDVDPKKVTIDCAKAGYRTVAVDRRIMRTAPKAPIEIDCKMIALAPGA